MLRADMGRFPRGSLSDFRAVATVAPQAVAKPAAEEPPKQCADLSTTCPNCSTEMLPEHAHYKCPACGYRDSCCF